MKETVSEKCPELAAQWSNRNLPLMPSDVTIGSHKRVWWRGSCGHEWQAIVKNRVNGSDCPYCNSNQLLKGFNDLATMKPELVSEWSDKNHPLMPDMVLSCTNKSVWWRCIQGHEWIAKIADRYYGSQCPYCEGHMLYKGFNDLASNYPELAKEWSEKNAPKRADEVFPKSRENVWWKCRVCGYEWRAVIDSRVKGSSCPVCSDRVVVAGMNDLATTDPKLISEWDYDRNTMISPEQMHRNSLRIVWWRCSRGHRWRAKIADRAIDKEPCHICRKEFDKEFPDILLRHYLKQAGYEVIIDEEELIGIPLANYIKEKNAVIEFSKPFYNTKDGYRWEFAKTQLCKNARIKLIRILRQRDKEFEDCVCITKLNDSDEALADAVYSEDQPNGEIIPNSLPFSQASTALNHGGSWLSISTIEVGYVNYRNAYFNGTPMELSDVLSFDIDGDGKIDYSLCIWRYDYDFTTGIFNAISRSAEYPWNTVYISNFTIR